MAQVTLIGPRRLNLGGVIFKRGEMVEMDDVSAVQFEDNPRFKVRGIRLPANYAPPSRAVPLDGFKQPASQLDAIRAAVDELDPDDDDAFDRSGKPSLRALSALVGFDVSGEMRDRAMSTRTAGQLDTAEGGEQTSDGAPAPAGLKLRPRLSREQKETLAKKAASIQTAVPSGTEAAAAVQEQAREEPEEAMEM